MVDIRFTRTVTNPGGGCDKIQLDIDNVDTAADLLGSVLDAMTVAVFGSEPGEEYDDPEEESDAADLFALGIADTLDAALSDADAGAVRVTISTLDDDGRLRHTQTLMLVANQAITKKLVNGDGEGGTTPDPEKGPGNRLPLTRAILTAFLSSPARGVFVILVL